MSKATPEAGSQTGPMTRSRAPGRAAAGAAADALVAEVCQALSQVAAAEWDRLLEPDDRPLLSWAYLQGLEETGCVGESTGWLPAHILVRRRVAGTARASGDGDGGGAADGGGELVAAAPVYVKAHSEAEWVYDYDWAEFAAGHGIAYYPKLVAAVPFNPVTGGRLLARTDLAPAERQALRRLLLEAMKKLCQQAELSSAHVLFPRGAGFRHGPHLPEAQTQTQPEAQPETQPGPALETDVMAAAGFVLRRQEQYHFLNEGYRDFEGFLARMSAHRRSTIRRERRALREAGITVRTHRGLAPTPEAPGDAPAPDGGQPVPAAAPAAAPDAAPEAALPFTRAELDQVFDLYVGTSQRYTGEAPFLNRAFFHLCADRLGDRLELVLARDRDGRLNVQQWLKEADTPATRAADAGPPWRLELREFKVDGGRARRRHRDAERGDLEGEARVAGLRRGEIGRAGAGHPGDGSALSWRIGDPRTPCPDPCTPASRAPCTRCRGRTRPSTGDPRSRTRSCRSR